MVPIDFISLLNGPVNEDALLNYVYRESSLLRNKLKVFLASNYAKKKEIKKWNEDYLDNIFFKINDISFLKHSILALSTKFPNTIINSVLTTQPYIPKHWGLSVKHELNLKKNIAKSTEPLIDIDHSENIEDIRVFLKEIQKTSSIFQTLSKVTYLPQKSRELSNKELPNKNKDLLEKIHIFYLLNILHIYVKTTEGMINQNKIKMSSSSSNKKRMDDLNNKLLSNCTLIIKSFVTILCDESRKIVLSYKKLTDKMNESKESEKDSMTQKLNMLTSEARNVEKVFKKHKIGKWGKGLEKGLRIYDKGTYDIEMDEMEDKEKKEIINRLLEKGIDKNGNTVDATDQSEMIGENEQEDIIEREDFRPRAGENEEDEYEYENDFD